MKIDSSFFNDLDNIPFLDNGDTISRSWTFNSSFAKLLDKYDGIVFYDTETTGLDAQGKDELDQPLQIIELAALRIEKDEMGQPKAVAGMDEFIKMNNNGQLPPSIIAFNEEKNTGITDERVRTEGIPEREAVKMFDDITKGNVLMVAYNAQFDMCFVHEMLQRSGVGKQKNIIHERDHLDPLTVFKDRKPYATFERLDRTPLPQVWDEGEQKMKLALPQGHKLEMALAYYSVDNYVENSHRAIDDVKAMYAATRKLDEQRSDLDAYVGIIGVNPKYGRSGIEHPNMVYVEQPYIEKGEAYPRGRGETVAAIVKSVNERIAEGMDMSKTATEISKVFASFDKELSVARANSYESLNIARIEGKPIYKVNELRDALIKPDEYPAFTKMKGDAIYGYNEFAKDLMAGKEHVIANVKDFLEELQSTPWISPSLKYTGASLEKKFDALTKELKLAPELKLGSAFEIPKSTHKFMEIKSNSRPIAKANCHKDEEFQLT
jgi:DNA polymerase-3 subunit epsilon